MTSNEISLRLVKEDTLIRCNCSISPSQLEESVIQFQSLTIFTRYQGTYTIDSPITRETFSTQLKILTNKNKMQHVLEATTDLVPQSLLPSSQSYEYEIRHRQQQPPSSSSSSSFLYISWQPPGQQTLKYRLHFPITPIPPPTEQQQQKQQFLQTMECIQANFNAITQLTKTATDQHIALASLKAELDTVEAEFYYTKITQENSVYAAIADLLNEKKAVLRRLTGAADVVVIGEEEGGGGEEEEEEEEEEIIQ